MGQVLTFAQQKGGAGKTTLLAHLAHAFALNKQKVALLDLDPQGSLSHWASLADIDNLTILETASYRIGGDIRSAKDRFDYVMVDCPGNASTILEAAIRESSAVLIPCQPSQMDVWASEAVTQMCTDLSTPAWIVLNRVSPRGKTTTQIRQNFADGDTRVLKSQIGNRIAFSRSFGEGKTTFQLPGQIAAKSEIEALRREIQRNLK